MGLTLKLTHHQEKTKFSQTATLCPSLDLTLPGWPHRSYGCNRHTYVFSGIDAPA